MLCDVEWCCFVSFRFEEVVGCWLLVVVFFFSSANFSRFMPFSIRSRNRLRATIQDHSKTENVLAIDFSYVYEKRGEGTHLCAVESASFHNLNVYTPIYVQFICTKVVLNIYFFLFSFLFLFLFCVSYVHLYRC